MSPVDPATHPAAGDREGAPARMPVLFVGHGSPMNAIEDNAYARAWERLGAALPRPKAILCVSAHWETRGTRVTAMERPKTIHDFFGFPPRLFETEYPAPGSPEFAERARSLAGPGSVEADFDWGLDHGTWSVLLRLFPEADVPTFQLSLDVGRDARAHYELARELAPLRDAGVLVVGSGNVVHNLRLGRFDDAAAPYDWAVEFDDTVARLVRARDAAALVAWEKLGPAALLSVPTAEHYLPLLYAIALRRDDDELSFPVEGIAFGSGSMRSVRFG